MRQFRILLFTLIAWLFLFFNVERLSAPINIASFVYIFITIAGALVALVPPLRRVSLSWLLVSTLPLYLLLKWQLGYPIAGTHLPITVTEVSAIVITIGLTRQIVTRAAALQDTIARVTLGHLKTGTDFAEGQGLIYREIRRARLHKRPVGLLAIAPATTMDNFTLDRFSKEAQEAIIGRYVQARIANLLLSELDDYNIVTQRNNHFVALLPEAAEDDVPAIMERLRRSAEEQLGIQLKIGLSHFPQDAVTFEQLLATAESRMAEHLATAGASKEGRSPAVSYPHSSNGSSRPEEEQSAPDRPEPADSAALQQAP